MQQYLRSPENQFQQEDFTIGWSWRLFVFSAIVFGSVTMLALGMDFGYKPFLEKRADDLNSSIDDLRKDVSAEEQENLFNFYSQVYNLQEILRSHPLPSRLLAFLSANTNVRVYYTALKYDQESAILTVNGLASSYADFAAQMEAFRRRPEVTGLSIENSGTLEENSNAVTQATTPNPVVPGQEQDLESVTFSLKVNFAKDFLKP